MTVLNLQNGSKQFSYINNVSSLNNCTVNFDVNGSPLFATINQGRRVNASIKLSANNRINAINNRFRGSDWHRIGTTSDGNFWLIRVCNPQAATTYYLHDFRKMSFIKIAVSNMSVQSVHLLPTNCVEIPVGTRRSVQGYITRPQNRFNNTPLIILLESEGRFNWEFNAMAQLLANRGYSVLSVNCYSNYGLNRQQDQSAIQTQTSDIKAISEWCINSGIALRGNINLLAKRSIAIPCTKVFINNQKTFASCVLISTDFPPNNDLLANLNVLRNLSKPMLVINSGKNSERYRNLYMRSDVRNANISYITYGKQPSDACSAGLIERFFSQIYKSAKENISLDGLSAFSSLADGCGILRNTYTYMR
jgi:hypothetical protein